MLLFTNLHSHFRQLVWKSFMIPFLLPNVIAETRYYRYGILEEKLPYEIFMSMGEDKREGHAPLVVKRSLISGLPDPNTNTILSWWWFRTSFQFQDIQDPLEILKDACNRLELRCRIRWKNCNRQKLHLLPHPWNFQQADDIHQVCENLKTNGFVYFKLLLLLTNKVTEHLLIMLLIWDS